jgi:hypothetical protein
MVLTLFSEPTQVEELMAERGLLVDHTTVWRWSEGRPRGLPSAEREGEIHDNHMAHGRNLRSDSWPVVLPVPCCGHRFRSPVKHPVIILARLQDYSSFVRSVCNTSGRFL